MKTIGDRLKLYISILGQNLKIFADYSKINTSTLSKIINEDKMPGGDTLTKLANTGLNINWLLIGKGEMLISESNLIQEKAEKILAETKLIIEKELGVKL